MRLALVAPIFTDIISHLNTIQKIFLWKSKYPNIKHETLRKSYEEGGLKSVNISSKILSLQCSWIQILCDKIFTNGK